MKTKVCCIFNLAAHYREEIFTLMDRTLHCDFFLGDRLNTPIKTMEYNLLKGYKRKLSYVPLFGPFYWKRGEAILAFRNYKFYIVTGEPFCLSTWVLSVIAFFTNKKIIMWTHGWYGREGFLKKQIKKTFYSLADTILLYGDYAKELMIEEGINRDKLYCIYNSLSYSHQLQIRETLSISSIFKEHFGNDNPVLLYVGRIQRVKRLDMLLAAVDVLKRKYDLSCNLVIVGKDVDGLYLENYIPTIIEKQVWFYGALYNESLLGELFYNSALCISPGNVGLTAIHSLTYGCPVITHDDFTNQMPEFESIVRGKTGDFFEEGDIEHLAFVIHRWIINNANCREEIRNNCYSMIDQKYNPVYQIKLLTKILSL